MSGKINGVDGSRPASAGAGRVSQRVQTSAGSPAGGASAGVESVHITDTASQLAALEQAIGDLPAVDESRVRTLRGAIEQGTYSVSPEKVADHLMQFEQTLDSLSRRGK